MTRPPCRKNDTDCPRRRVGCKSDCPEWQKWQEVHLEEARQIRRKKADAAMTDTVLISAKDRRRKYEQEKYQERHRRK